MVTALLIILAIIVLLATIGVAGYWLNQGFFCWIFFGQEAIKAGAYVIAIILTAISEANS